MLIVFGSVTTGSLLESATLNELVAALFNVTAQIEELGPTIEAEGLQVIPFNAGGVEVTVIDPPTPVEVIASPVTLAAPAEPTEIGTAVLAIPDFTCIKAVAITPF